MRHGRRRLKPAATNAARPTQAEACGYGFRVLAWDKRGKLAQVVLLHLRLPSFPACPVCRSCRKRSQPGIIGWGRLVSRRECLPMTAEADRLNEDRSNTDHLWRRWGPYVSERAWG